MKVVMGIADKETARMTTKEVTVSAMKAYGDTTYEGVSKIRPAIEGAHRRRQRESVLRRRLACIVMDGKAARPASSSPGHLSRFRRGGCEPDEMGIGPCSPCRSS